MKNIIVPIDYSPASINAAYYAASLAKHADAKIILFHSFPLCVPSPGMPFLFPDIDEVIIEHKLKLDDIGAEISRNYEISCISICRPTPVLEELQKLFKQFKADLVVMGMSGSSLDHKLFGSITISAIREGKFPILSVPQGCQFFPFKKILFACEYSCINSTNELVPLQIMATLFNSKIQILHVEKVQLVPSIESVVTESTSVNFESLLNNLPHEYKYLEAEDVEQGIARGKNEYKPELIAMVPHKLGFWEDIFRRGKTDKVAYHSEIPLLSMPNI